LWWWVVVMGIEAAVVTALAAVAVVVVVVFEFVRTKNAKDLAAAVHHKRRGDRQDEGI
jgi:hypothetical protein